MNQGGDWLKLRLQERGASSSALTLAVVTGSNFWRSWKLRAPGAATGGDYLKAAAAIALAIYLADVNVAAL